MERQQATIKCGAPLQVAYTIICILPWIPRALIRYILQCFRLMFAQWTVWVLFMTAQLCQRWTRNGRKTTESSTGMMYSFFIADNNWYDHDINMVACTAARIPARSQSLLTLFIRLTRFHWTINLLLNVWRSSRQQRTPPNTTRLYAMVRMARRSYSTPSPTAKERLLWRSLYLSHPPTAKMLMKGCIPPPLVKVPVSWNNSSVILLLGLK